MKSLSKCILCLSAWIVAITAMADPQPKQIISRFGDDQTVLIARFDPRQVDFAEVDSLLTSWLKDSPEEMLQAAKMAVQGAKQWREAWTQAGGREVYWLLSVYDIPLYSSGLFVAPLDANADAGRLKKLLAETGPKNQHTVEDSFLLASDLAHDQRTNRPGVEESILFQAPLAHYDKAVAAVALAPTSEMRRAIRELSPILPRFLEQIPNPPFHQSLVWASLSMRIPSGAPVKLVIQSQTPESAKEIAQYLNQLFPHLLSAQSPLGTAWKEMIPEWRGLLTLLKPAVQDNRLEWDVSGQKVVSMFAGPMTQSMAKARSEAVRIQCMNNLKQIGLACHIYASNHKDQFPPDIMAMQSHLGSPRLLICPEDKDKPKVSNWKDFDLDGITYRYDPPKEKEPKADTVILTCPIHGNVALMDGSVRHRPIGMVESRD